MVEHFVKRWQFGFCPLTLNLHTCALLQSGKLMQIGITYANEISLQEERRKGKQTVLACRPFPAHAVRKNMAMQTLCWAYTHSTHFFPLQQCVCSKRDWEQPAFGCRLNLQKSSFLIKPLFPACIKHMAQTQGLVLSYLRTVREQCFLFFSGLISHALWHIALARNGAGIHRLLASGLGVRSQEMKVSVPVQDILCCCHLKMVGRGSAKGRKSPHQVDILTIKGYKAPAQHFRNCHLTLITSVLLLLFFLISKSL